MKKITALLVLGSLFLGTGLSVAASAAGPDLDGVVYWAEEEVDSLFSPELMRALALTPSQRGSFQELRDRDWGYRPEHRYSGQLDALFGLGGMIRPGGPRVVIERENDNLRTFLALLAFGLLLSQAQDTDRYYDPGYGYDYGYGYGYGYVYGYGYGYGSGKNSYYHADSSTPGFKNLFGFTGFVKNFFKKLRRP